MTIEQSIKDAMARMIERKQKIEGVEVHSWAEEFERGYFDGCDTCGNGADEDTYVVDICYTRSGMTARNGYYRHEGTFAELIKELDNQ